MLAKRVQLQTLANRRFGRGPVMLPDQLDGTGEMPVGLRRM